MEPDVKYFLLCIVQSISMVMLWMFVNMMLGIYFEFAFFDKSPSLGNYIYAAFLIITFVLLIRYLQKKWKGWKEPGE